MRRTTWPTLCLTLLAAGRAWAQPSPDGATRRRELLERASEMSRRGDHATALRLGEEAGRIQVTPSLQMFLAEEHEFLADGAGGGGHLLDAVIQATTCVRDATAQAALNNRERILRRCAEVAGRLNPRVARVRVLVRPPIPAGLRVHLDARELSQGLLGEPQPVLPGEVIVEVSAPERGTFRRAVRVSAGADEVVQVTLPEGPPEAPRPDDGDLSDASIVAPAAGSPPSRALPLAGWSIVGVGVAASAVGVWQWLVTSGQERDALNSSGAGAAWARYANAVNPQRSLTLDDVCDRAASEAAGNPDAAGALDLCGANARAKALAWGFGLGGVALATVGVVLVIVGGRREPSRVTAAPVLGPGVGGAALRVAF